MDLKLSTQTIRTIAIFEKVPRVHPKDCITAEHALYFLVDVDKMGMAIGKDGVHIKELRRIAGKNIKIFGYVPNLEEFIRLVVPTVKTLDIQDKNVTIS